MRNLWNITAGVYLFDVWGDQLAETRRIHAFSAARFAVVLAASKLKTIESNPLPPKWHHMYRNPLES